MNAVRDLLIYGVCGLLTFGFVAANTDCKPALFDDRLERDCRVMRASFAAVAWPLYWTWEAFERAR